MLLKQLPVRLRRRGVGPTRGRGCACHTPVGRPAQNHASTQLCTCAGR